MRCERLRASKSQVSPGDDIGDDVEGNEPLGTAGFAVNRKVMPTR